MPIGSEKLEFKERLIILLARGLIASVVLISLVFGLFIYSYFWSDYNVLNSNENINSNTISSEGGDKWWQLNQKKQKKLKKEKQAETVSSYM